MTITRTSKIACTALAMICICTGLVAQTSSSATKFLYAVNELSNSISVYGINSATGVLTPVAGSPFSTPPMPHWIALNPSGTTAYVVTDNSTVSNLVTFSINKQTGALVNVDTLSLPSPSFSVPMVERSGKFLMLAGARSNTADLFILDPAKGKPSRLASFPAGNLPWSVAVDPLNRFVYVAGSSNRVVGYQLDASLGKLTQVAGSPVQVRSLIPIPSKRPVNQIVIMDASGNFLYVTDPTTKTIAGYSVAPGTGSLTPVSGSPFPCQGIAAFDVVVDPAGPYLYAGDWDKGVIAAFSMANSGTLVPIPGSPFATPFMTTSKPGGAITLAVDPSGHFLYAASTEANQIVGFTIDPASGAIHELSAPVATEQHPFRLAIVQ
jgi:6-phosphogluconolactonase (cycloisomerase 2 family)